MTIPQALKGELSPSQVALASGLMRRRPHQFIISRDAENDPSSIRHRRNGPRKRPPASGHSHSSAFPTPACEQMSDFRARRLLVLVQRSR